MTERPTGESLSLLVAGIMILFFGLFVSGARTADPDFVATANLIYLDALVCGLVVILAGALVYILPSLHVIWGALAVVFALSSIISLGGLIIGMILGTTAGAMSIVWKPHRQTQ